MEVKDHFDSDINVLLHDKEQLESTQRLVRQLETNLELLNKELQETILKDKQQIDILKKNLATENEQHLKSFDALKTEYENLTNELHQIKQAKDHIQSLFDQTIQEQTQKHEHPGEDQNKS